MEIKTDNQSIYPWKRNLYSWIIETYKSKGCVSFCVSKFSKLQKVIKASLNVTFECLSTYTWDLHRARGLVKSQRVLRSLANLYRMHLAHQLGCFCFSTNSTLRHGGMYFFKNGVTIALNDSVCVSHQKRVKFIQENTHKYSLLHISRAPSKSCNLTQHFYQSSPPSCLEAKLFTVLIIDHVLHMNFSTDW